VNLTAGSLMLRSPDLKGRIEYAAHGRGQTNMWVDQNIDKICATDGWADAWTTALQQAVSVGDFKPNLGARTDVITDDQITKAVTDLLAQQAKDDATAVAAQSSTDQQIASLTATVQQLQAQIAALTPPATDTGTDGGTPA